MSKASCSIQLLGTSDGLPSADRSHAAILMNLGRRAYLFDCGEPISHTLKSRQVSFDAFDRLFISHLHSDHCGGFPMLIQSCWLETRRKDLPVHMPAEGIRAFRELLRATYLFDGLFPFKLSFQPLQAGRRIEDDDVTITPYPTSHLKLLQRDFGKAGTKQKFEAFSFLIDAGALRVAYSADIGATSDLDPLVKKPLDVLIVELAHFSAANLFEYLAARPIGRVVLTHIGRQYWKNPELPRLTKRYFGRKRCRCQIAQDGIEIIC